MGWLSEPDDAGSAGIVEPGSVSHETCWSSLLSGHELDDDGSRSSTLGAVGAVGAEGWKEKTSFHSMWTNLNGIYQSPTPQNQ